MFVVALIDTKEKIIMVPDCPPQTSVTEPNSGLTGLFYWWIQAHGGTFSKMKRDLKSSSEEKVTLITLYVCFKYGLFF